MSSAEAQRFVDVVTSVTETIKALGKFEPADHKMALDAAEATLGSETIRWMVGKQVKTTNKGDVYGRKWDEQSFKSILNDVLEREYHAYLIREAIKAGKGSPREISVETGLDLRRVSYLIADREKRSMVEFTGMEERKPVFAAL